VNYSFKRSVKSPIVAYFTVTALNSPDGVICLQEILGSGFPLAVQMSETLLPSFAVMSDEMS